MKRFPEPSLSVIIPVRDRSESLRIALGSAIAQTHPPSEIIVVDDGSRVAPDIGCDFGEIQTRIIRLNESGGPAAARQAGVDSAGGDLIAFLDSDDAWLPWKIEAQMRRVHGMPLESLWAVSCGWFYTDDRKGLGPRIVPAEAAETRLFAAGCWFNPGSTVLLPRSAFVRLGGFDPALRRLEDYEWFLRFGRAGGRLLVAPAAGAVIHRRSRSSQHVEAAAQLILKRLQASSFEDEQTSPSWRAWLELERSAAAKREAQFGRALVHLARSLYWRPRARLHLERWWTEVQEPAPASAVSLARSLANAVNSDAHTQQAG